MCYVQTMQLDGETNLKLRRALDVSVNFSGLEPGAWANFNGFVHCEDPTPFFDKFTGACAAALHTHTPHPCPFRFRSCTPPHRRDDGGGLSLPPPMFWGNAGTANHTPPPFAHDWAVLVVAPFCRVAAYGQEH